MAYQSQQISVTDLSKGIDQRSAPNAIPEGFSEDLQNVITNSSGFLAKRPGYEGYYGYLPIRVKSIRHTGTSITFTLDSSINVGNTVSSPIVVYGKLSSAQSGDFTTTAAGRYYTVFNNEIRSVLTAPSDTETVAHAVATDEVLLQINQSTDNANNDNTWFIPDVLSVSTTGNNDVEVTGTIPTDVNFFTLIDDPAEIYVHPDQTIASGATTVITISAATHGLSNYNIIPHVYYLASGKYIRIEMVDVTVNSSTGSVAVTITNSAASSIDVRVVLSNADSADVEIKTINATTTDTIVVSTANPFNFFAVYNTVGAVNTLIIPDSVVYDSDAEELTITIQNGSTSAESFRVYWREVEIASSQLTVTDTGAVSTNYTDTAPQLTLWGISHEDLYTTNIYQEGHVNLIDTYRTDTQTRVVSGLGGNLFTAQTRSELDSGYKVPTANIDLEGQLASDVILAPLFVTTGEATDRTTGAVAADDVVENAALITAVEYVSSGVIKYTLSLTNKSGSLATAVTTTSAVADRLTVTGMANDINNGTFKITAVDNSANTITVSNSLITFAGFNESGAMGRAGIFTDRITLTANSKFQVGDVFSDSVFSGFTPTVLTSSTTTVVLEDVTDRAFITTGTILYPAREASVIPLASSMANFVKGDMCTIDDINRKVRVVSVNNNSDLTISSITSDGETATLTTSTAHNLQAGDKIVLLRTGVAAYDAEQTITSIINTTSLTFDTTEDDSSSTGVILGKTVAIDEEVTIHDDPTAPDTLTVVGRWIPVEAPTTSDTLPKTTYTKHFTAKDYHKQEPMRATMVNDNLYMTDYYDEVMKFDGTSIYRAGLIRWQPQLFAQIDTTTASIPLSGVTANPSAIAGNKFTVATGEAAQFSVGDIFTHDTYTYTVQSVDTVNNLIYSTLAASSTNAAENIYKTTRYKYYFRLNAIDANNNIIASAATGKDDFVVDLSASGQIHIRLTGMPVWGNYDYDTIELEVYRTQAAGSLFYRVAVKDVSFSAGYGYLDFKDSVTDEFLSDSDPVSVATRIAPGVGTGWSAPLRAKYLTSLDNRLILGNVTGYPELDIVMRATTSIGGITATNLAGKKFRFKKDTTSASTATDMVNIVNYEFVTSATVTPIALTSISTTSTTFTVTKAAHGLEVGNWVYLYHSALGTVNKLDYAGWFQIAAKDTNTFTINFSNHRGAFSAGDDVNYYVTATTKTDIPVWIGTDGNRNIVGANIINEFTAMTRLADAINASMRVADVTLASTFIPWMTAAAGNGIGNGRILVQQEKVSDTTMAVVLPASTDNTNYYVKGILQAASAEVDATATSYQSRVLVSYSNNPELFDNPTGDEISSASVIDINSADGQEITGVIPFFGDSVFGQGTSETVLVVFKTNSIYLVDVTNRTKSKIQSRGLGCTAPHSIAPTRDGIMFVNDSGIYKLTRDQSIVYIGATVERIFKDEVNIDRLSDFRGHQYGVGGQYKLSVPVGEDQIRNNQVLVYDHQGEQQGANGAWTRFTNHPATGWTDLASESFFGTSNGQVFKIRDAGDSSDYRDDADAVDTMVILLRANALGAPGSRKIIFNIVSHFQLRTTSMTGTQLLSSADLDGNFVSAGTFTLTKGARNKAETVKSSLPTRRLNYIQLKYTNSTKDEDVILSGVEYTAALLNVKGINEQSETT